MGNLLSKTEVYESQPTIKDLRKKLLEVLIENHNALRNLSEDEFKLMQKMSSMRKLNVEDITNNLTEEDIKILHILGPKIEAYNIIQELLSKK